MFGFVPSVRFVLRSASSPLASWRGLALAISVHPSRRSLSGWVAVVSFSSSAAAHWFALLWAARLPAACRGCVVRCVSGGFAVSVPIARSLGV